MEKNKKSFIEHLEQVFEACKGLKALVYAEKEYSYDEMSLFYKNSFENLSSQGIRPGSVVAIIGDFDPLTVSTFLALIKLKVVIVPLLRSHSSAYVEDAIMISGAQYKIIIQSDLSFQITKLTESTLHPLIQDLNKISAPGLLLFSSGSTGKPKAALHNFERLLEKFVIPPHRQTMINFLMFDHWGGLNTLFYILGGSGTVITTNNRSPENICKLLERWQIEVLPTSPSFLNLLLLSKAYEGRDLTKLKLITYGSEPMPQSTLEKARVAFPGINFKQTYGLIELGVFKTKSKSNDSLFIKIDSNDCDYRIVDGMLELKTKSAMLGYLNAPSPFTEDGYFKTHDAVEVDGDYLRILGRKSDLIIIGGEKVYPVEVEARILEFPNVEDVIIYKESHPLMGNLVCAKVKLINPEDDKAFVIKLKKFCAEIFPPYKVPSKIKIVTESLSTGRQKKARG